MNPNLFRETLSHIDFTMPGWDIIQGSGTEPFIDNPYVNMPWFQVRAEMPDATEPIEERSGLAWATSNRVYMDRGWSVDDLVVEVRNTIEWLWRHEVGEFFLFHGERVFGPHTDLVMLAAHLTEVNA